MRVLFTTTGHAGHVLPLVPFARACLRAGHDVLVATPRARTAAVERAALPFSRFADPPAEQVDPIWRASFDVPPEEANALVIGQLFGRINTRAALPGVLRIVDEWQPDVVVRESYELAGCLAARRRGIPHVRVVTGLGSTEKWLLGFVAAATDDVPIAAIRAEPSLSLNPVALDAPSDPRTHRFRDAQAAARPLPDWWHGRRDPLVYVSFGSVAGALDFFPGLYRAAADALAELPVRVLVTVGEARDPRALGPLPANVHAERWVPQADVFPQAAAMVAHGGYGSTLGALAHGVPLVIAPLFADQFRNARRVERLGAALPLPALGSLREGMADARAALAAAGPAVERVLSEPRFRRAADRIAAGVQALAPVDEAVAVLHGLARPALGRAA